MAIQKKSSDILCKKEIHAVAEFLRTLPSDMVVDEELVRRIKLVYWRGVVAALNEVIDRRKSYAI